MKTLLLTGGAGFIGSNFVRLGLEAGFRIVNVDALTYAGNLASLSDIEQGDKYKFVEGDITDLDLMRNILREEKPSIVVNMAAESHVDRSIDDPATFVRTNVVGVQMLLEASLEYWKVCSPGEQAEFRFVQISTDEVYGSIPDGVFVETSNYAPNSPYAASKAAGDHLVRAYFKTYGLPILLTNCSNNYGPYQYPEKLIPLIVTKALRREAIPVYGDGKNVRDWIHVHDHCHGILSVAKKGIAGETYLIGSRNEMRNIDLVRAICGLLDDIEPSASGSYTDLIEFVTDRPGHDGRYAISPRKIERELGWKAKVSFESGLRDTILWYKENDVWLKEVQGRKEEGERRGVRYGA